MVDIREVTVTEEKTYIASDILNKLPNWFGIPESTQEYIDNSANYPFFAIFYDNTPIGFLSIKYTSNETAEIYVMGILEGYHGKGYGRKLFEICKDFCKDNGYKYLQVKTLDISHPDPYYAKTRKFYEKIGFSKLECFKEIWDEFNPCLVYIMKI